MSNKVALVTGGSRGIGRGIVLALAQAGWEVVASYRADRRAMKETIEQIERMHGLALAVQADLRRESDRHHLVEEALSACGRIDLLVNNAGVAPRVRGDLLELAQESYDEVLETNLKGPFFLTQQVARIMIEQVHNDSEITPKIINIGSVSAYASSTLRAEYCISKAGMAMMTSLFADRLAEEGILVYEVRPGIIETDMTAGVHDTYDQMIGEGLLPIRRWGTPEDVARAVLALAEGVLPYSTGEVINVDGGFHLRRL
jgi:NAD(P)-dependent dehydrogenase (short-subunit alcohol dehydrogenase family)